MDKCKTFEADAQSSEVVKPGDGALDDPAGFAQSAVLPETRPPKNRTCEFPRIRLKHGKKHLTDAGCTCSNTTFADVASSIHPADAGKRR